MSSSSDSRNSETALMQSIHKLSSAGGSVIQVRTREPMRAALVLRKHLIGGDAPYKEWDCVNGFRVFTRENLSEHKVVGDGADLLAALTVPMEELRKPSSEIYRQTDKTHYFVYVDPHPYITNNFLAAELLQQYATILPSTNVCTILVTPEVTLPEVPVGTVLIADMPTPGPEELVAVLRRILKDRNTLSYFPDGCSIEDDDYERIAYLGLGLSLFEFETYAAIAVIEATESKESELRLEHLLEGVAKGKTAVVRQSEILELTHTEEIDNVGGMQRLKKWLEARADCYTDEARSFGIEPPKGMVLVGVPGTGKSLAAKATASRLGMPLIRFDFGRVFSKYVGDSESRVRSALKMVEGMAPVVLFVDEIDKGLGGAGGGGDSGTSSRVLGSFLTWLQECKAPVFTVVTANRVDGLPPELLRRGRFDQIFSVGLPDADTRKEVLDIHLRKRKRTVDDIEESDMLRFVEASKDYVPAEIESAVKDALIAAFNGSNKRNKTKLIDHIITALQDMVPMSKSHKESVDRIVAWARDNATPVDSDTPKVAVAGSTARILRQPVRR